MVQSEDLPDLPADKPVGKRKRSPKDADGVVQDSMPQRGVLVPKPDSKQQSTDKGKVRAMLSYCFNLRTIVPVMFFWKGVQKEGMVI